MRRVAVEYFGNLAEAFLRGVSAYLRQPLPGLCPSFARMALHVEVCGDKRSHQPGPDRALVIGAVAAPGIALVPAAIPRMAGGQAAQAPRRQEMPLDSVHNGFGFIGRKHLVEEAHGEDLVRPHGGIADISIDDVVEALRRLVPE